MKRILCLALIFIIFCAYKLSAQQWLWAKNVSYSFNDADYPRLGVDGNGNFYLAANSNSSGTCLIKYNNQGNEIWRNYITGNINIAEISCYANSVFITGDFSGTVVIGNDTLTSYGQYDVFVLHLLSNGSIVSAKHYGSSSNDSGNGICATSHGIFVTGSYGGTANFGISTQTCQGSSNMFLMKLDLSGNVLLVKHAGSMDSTWCSGQKVRMDNAGNIFILGRFMDIVLDTFHVKGDHYFGSNFMCRLDSMANTLWVEEVLNGSQQLYDFTLDQASNILATGDGGWRGGGWTTTRKYNPNGQLLWNQEIQGSIDDGCMSQAIAAGGLYSYIVGDALLHHPPDWTHYNYFFLGKYDASGALIVMDTIRVGLSSSSNCVGTDIVRDANGDFVVCGTMFGNFSFGNDPLSSSVGNVFIAKFADNISNSVINENKPEIMIYPNPSKGIFNIKMSNNASRKFIVRDLLGNCILEKSCWGEIDQEIDLTGQPKGLYFVEFQSASKMIVRKIVLR